MDWVISDIHGCFHTLTALIEKVRIADSFPKFIFVGDYVDRGKYNREVVDFVINLQSNENAVCLRGNHDDVVDFILNDHSLSDTKEWIPTWAHKMPQMERLAYIASWWIQNGLAPTLESYGVSLNNLYKEHTYGPAVPLIASKEFIAKVPDDHKSFFRSLGLFWSNETHFACHGFMRPFEDLPRDFRFIKSDLYHETLWSRFPNSPVGGIFLPRPVVWDKIGIFGHTPTRVYQSPVPIKHDKIRLIDTLVFKRDGYLTAYCCQSDDWILQATNSEDI